MSMLNNHAKALLINAAWAFILTQSLLVLYLNNRGLSLSQIFIIQTIHSFVILFFDIPTSYLADKYGFKFVLISAGLLRGIGGCFFYFSHNFELFIVTYIFIGLGNSMINGVDVAMLLDREDSSKNRAIFSKNYLLTRFAMISSTLAGSIIAMFSVNLTAFLNMITSWAPLLIILTLKYPERSNHLITKSIHHFNTDYYNFKWEKGIILMIGLIAVYTSIPTINLYFGQTLFLNLHLPIIYYGAIICIAQAMMFSILPRVKTKPINVSFLFQMLAITALVLYMLFGFSNIVAFALAILISEYIRLISQTYLVSLINQISKTKFKAVINSCVNFGSAMLVFFVGMGISKAINHYPYYLVAVMVGVLIFIITQSMLFKSNLFIKRISHES